MASSQTKQPVQRVVEEEDHKPEDMDNVQPKHLIPRRPLFVETDEVKNLKDRAIHWISVGSPIHIIGPTGCGKTTMAMEIAYELEAPVTWINGDDQITTEDLVGGYKEFEQQTYRDRFVHNVFRGKDKLQATWVDNPLTIACKNGYTFVYNEFSRTKPEANNVLLSVLEEGILELPNMSGNERYIEVHPEFNAILTSNSVEYAGIHRAQDALLDRIVGLYMDYYGPETELKIVTAHTDLPMENVKELVRIIRGLRSQLDPAERPGTRACVMVAKSVEEFEEVDDQLLKQLILDVLTSKTKGIEDMRKKEKILSNLVNKD